MAVSSKVRIWWLPPAGAVWLYLDFAEWCKFIPEYNVPAKSIPDRYGIVHRLVPTTLAKKLRWPIAATVEPRPEDVLTSADYTAVIDTASTGSSYFELGVASSDVTAIFGPSKSFVVGGSTGNDGTYTVKSVSFTASKTRITVNETVADGTGDGTITNTFSLPEVIDYWAVGAYSVTTPISDTEFYIYHYEDGVNDDGGAVVRRQGYKVHFSQIPRDILGTLVFIDGETPDMRMEFIVIEDGTFTDFEIAPTDNDPDTSADSYVANPISRPT